MYLKIFCSLFGDDANGTLLDCIT